MKNSHRARIESRDDYDKWWKLSMWRKPHVHTRVVKCAICAGTDILQRERRQTALRKAARQAWRETLLDI